ncbi:unnamed protein product [Rotaria magnacalcarata]|uniref:Uncharacterized protein n=1 Tax=Rotaria magnacalcarata TaxID=392030 RepID=A0A816VS91_9BILA|nr:unnamed protein product [Rotaria magnacalcarata]CAF2167638.1 unnamed protein product [Rotaria magnacalcarata]CAF3983312.1 unnamed protein product [Rotaria magnacalcarata]CAF3994630.1 unnamed protein product [Rotaria magnacalcarata]
MVTFNSSVIYHLIRLKRTTMIHHSHIQHRSIAIILVITTFLFLIMTVPSNVAFAFFSSSSFDCLVYSYHALSFPLYMITYDEFRGECFSMLTCKKNNGRFAPQTQTLTVPQMVTALKTVGNILN